MATLALTNVRTNYVPNSMLVGAAAGSPGTAPNTSQTFSIGTFNGVSFRISAVGTEAGAPYVDVSVLGTCTGNASLQYVFGLNNSIAVSSGQTWTASVFARVTAGAALGSAVAFLTPRLMDSSFVNSEFPANVNISMVPSAIVTRVKNTITIGSATTVWAIPRFFIVIASGETYDFTVRLSAPQMELSTAATDWIPTSSGSVTIGASTVGTIAAALARSRALASAATASGTIAATILRKRALAAALTAGGTLATTVQRSRAMQASLSALGNIAASIQRAKGLTTSATLSGLLTAALRGGSAILPLRTMAAPSDARATGVGGPAFTPKDPGDSARFSYDMTLALPTGDACTGLPTVTEATGALTIGNPSLLGNVITARIGGGVAGRIYRITWSCSTAAGDTLRRSTPLLVDTR